MMNEREEASWVLGHRAAWNAILAQAVRELGFETCTREALIIEREQTIALLRRVCAEHGDNDWSNDLHMADIIEKHLERHIGDDTGVTWKEDIDIEPK